MRLVCRQFRDLFLIRTIHLPFSTDSPELKPEVVDIIDKSRSIEKVNVVIPPVERWTAPMNALLSAYMAQLQRTNNLTTVVVSTGYGFTKGPKPSAIGDDNEALDWSLIPAKLQCLGAYNTVIHAEDVAHLQQLSCLTSLRIKGHLLSNDAVTNITGCSGLRELAFEHKSACQHG